MTSLSQNLLPLRGGVNYAPLKPLLELKSNASQPDSHYLTDAITERYKHYMQDRRETWQELIMMGYLTALFIEGKQNLRFNHQTKSFYAIPEHDRLSSAKKISPIMRFYQTNCEARYTSANPKINVTAGREDDKARQAAQAAKVIVDHFEKKHYTNWFNGNEALLMMCFGTQITQTKWDSGLKGFAAFRDVFEDKEFPISDGVGQCFDCGHSGTGSEYVPSAQLPVCPNCQSQNVYAEPPTTQIIPVKTGQEEINLGDICVKQLEFPACRWDLKGRAEDSSWLVYEQMLPLGAIQNLLGNVNLDAVESASDVGLNVVEALAGLGASINGDTSPRDVRSALYKRQVKITELYLSPDDYADINLRGDEQTVSGERLPSGGKMKQLYPNGCVAILANGKYLLGLYGDESHKNELTTGVWHKRAFSGAGQGVSDAVAINNNLNETESQGFMAMKHSATPGLLYAQNSIAEEHVNSLGLPDVNIPINLDEFPNITSLNQLVHSPRIGNIDTGIISYFSENLRNLMQLTMNSTSFSGGLPGVNNKTATGAQISEANAASLFAPMLGVKVDVRIRNAKNFVELYRKNVPVAQFFPLKSRYGAQQGIWLSGADIDADLSFDVVQNSELPRNAYSVREDHDRFFQMVGGAQGLQVLRQTDPEYADELMRVYGVDYETNHFDEVAQICRERLEAAKKLAAQFAQLPMAAFAISPAPPNFSPNALTRQMPSESIPGGAISELQTEDKAASGAGATSDQMMPPLQSAPVQPPLNPLEMMAIEVVENITPPISVYETFHLDKAEWFAKSLDTDEGKTADLLMRQVIYKFIEKHYMSGARAAALKAQLQGQINLAGQMPGQIADVAKQQALNANNQEKK